MMTMHDLPREKYKSKDADKEVGSHETFAMAPIFNALGTLGFHTMNKSVMQCCGCKPSHEWPF